MTVNTRGVIYSFVFLLYFLDSCTTEYFSCTYERVILTNTTGVIRNGPAERRLRSDNGEGIYKSFSRCEWLIDTQAEENARRSIMLEVTFLETECSYDYLFVYDGNSHKSPLIASLSGNTLSKTLVARSGYMLLLQFSDRNYELGGFLAKYSVEDCPYGCSGHGDCINFSCFCDSQYVGDICQYEICPDNCSEHGQCVMTGDKRHWGCKCSSGYAGLDCSVALNGDTKKGRLEWRTLMPEVKNFTNRLDHGAVYDEISDCIFVFGGYTLNSILDDLQKYCFQTNYWEYLNRSEPWPSGRHQHAMVYTEGGFYVFGGFLAGGVHSSELWYYNISLGTWTLKAENSSVQIKGLSGHTMTLAGNYMYVIGGKTDDGLYSHKMYRIDPIEPNHWEEVLVTGGRLLKRLLHGHSAVYHKETHTVLIYGGTMARSARYTELSSRIFAFNVKTHYWTEIYNAHQSHSQESFIPRQRAHHIAAIVGNYMVVYGGNVHIHQEEEKCYDEKIYFYHLGCHQWVQHPSLKLLEDSRATEYLPSKGRFAHAAITMRGNNLIVIGGYRGYVMGDMLFFKFPGVIAPPQAEQHLDRDYCMNYTENANHCINDLECLFCLQRKDISRPGCVHRTRPEMCVNKTMSTPCQGICSQLTTCHTCLNQGQGVTLTSMSRRRRVYQDDCSWCVKNSTCQKKSVPEGSCRFADGTKSGKQGWWGGLSASWTQVDQCSENDIPGGIQWMKYYTPANLSQPDEVEYLGEIKSSIKYQASSAQEVGFILSKYYGYIWPLEAEPVLGTFELKPYLRARGTYVNLSLSTDDTAKNLQLVGEVNYTTSTQVTIDTHRGDRRNRSHTQIFPNVSRKFKYFFVMEAKKRYQDDVNASLELQWNADVGKYTPTSRYIITTEFLEPYHSGNCGNYSNCLACMTDASCGWCATSNMCIVKGSNLSASCDGTNGTTFPVTSPSHCLHCPDYVDCWSCVKNELCEWRPEIEQCFRRGRFQDLAVQKVEQCAVACHRRKSCSSCVQEKDECFWCDTTMTCLPFAHYSANFIHGQCRDWIDSEGKNEYYCRDCSLKTNCETCLGTFGCGWCGDHLDRRKGKCVQGDFNGPYNENCSAVLLEHSISSNVSLSGHHNWTYGKCLDVDECKLGIGDCHPNATCYNLEGSYGCRCNQGFQGDGKNCTLTCYYDCGDHGRCSVSPNYTCICDLGWTGVDCATDCNCNYQSTCSRGVGMCDQCENNTEGPNCEHCKFGYYARNPLYGCSECHCNGHGNESSGICHNVTGQCFCTGNTTGDMCETCVPHHYGNPKNGGRCYRQCENRLELYQSSGSLGLQVNHLQNSWVIYCLWIIKIPSSLHQYLTPMVYIEVENISTKCGQDHVNIYNDVPRKLMSTTVNADDSGQVASLCGTRKTSFTVTTSIITVYFYTGNVSESGNSPPGFNISWKVLPIDGSFEPCLSGCNYSQSNHSCVCSSEVNTMAISTSVHPAQAIHSMDFKTLHEEIGRYGHSLVVSGEDTMLMFGGYSLKYGLMNDIWEYNTARMHWTKMNPMNAEEPTGRYYHAAVYVPILKEMYVYGGLISYGSPERVFASKELWKFSIGPRVWNRLDVSSEYNALAGHSMTLVGDTTLLIIGGFSSESYFNDHIYEYNTMAGGLKGWREHNPLKGAVPVGLYGHSTVYHKETETLYIYGGMEYKDYKFEVSKDLLTYDVTQRRWSHLLPEQGSKYDARMLHTAVDLGDYMVVLGGLASHNVDRNAAAQSILMYRYKCNVWHQLSLHDLQYGELLTSLVSPKAVAIKGTIYLIGGFDGQGNSRLVKVHFPEDLCVQYDGEKCLKNARCMQCLMTLPSDFDVFDMCYSADRHIPPMCHSGKVSGTPCNLQWYKEQNCSRHTSCHSCKATYPYFKYENQPCWWCEQSNKCVSVKDKELECDGADLQVFGQSSCINNPCRAADCDKCQRSDMCIWTNSNYKSDEQHIVIDKEPLYTWNCFSQSTYANPHHPHTANCKSWCFYSSTCQECLKSNGMEGGSRECVWSQTLQECMTPAYLPLRCSSGECGALLYKGQGYSENRCPLPCTQHYICAECVKEPGCGWCAFSGQNGEGVCMDGGIDGPLGTGKCSAESVKPSSGHLTLHQIRKLRQSKLPPTWDYMTCPPENECKNAHHNCDNMNQNCIDQLDGFKCTCKGGYIEQESGVCTPVCHNPCKRGRCVEPEKCECDFGWVGLQCKISCECNGNSNCLSEIRLDTCLECKNNTKGTQCQFCKPMYVGDPVQRIPCEPCFSFCNNHTETCSKCDNMNYCKEQHGPTPEFALCLNCANNTRGSRCEECRDGYFRVDKNGQKKHEACRKCQCNGHSDTCDPNTGESCQCKNNTETGCHLGSDKDSKNECWRRQCSKCKEYFMGNPVDGHHCYRQMTVDQEYCLDPTTQTNCIGAEPLLQHQTVFFGVQPRYLNVDIRITLDISEGAVDVYFSSSEKTFVVNVDSVTGGHRVSLDSELSDEVWTDADKNTHHNRKKRGLDNEMGLHRFMYDGTLNNVWSDDYNPSDSAKKRTRRSVRNSTSGQFHNLFELTANYFHTYQTIEETNTIMKIANVQSRLVLTLPLELHDLRTSKFYIILYGTGNKQSNKTYGNLYFRQDQPHIDLFVFFSVFFSSFFLFLAKCVLLWKLKQAIDAQRSRQQQQKEMAHMASRPFAKVLVLVEPEQVMYSSTPVPRRRTKLTKLSHRNPHLTLTPVETFLPPPIPNINTYNSTVSKTFCPFDIVPIATEPIGNGAASLRTIIFQLPGGNSAPCKLSLGTTLTGNSRTNMTNTKTGVRQRSNHSTC